MKRIIETFSHKWPEYLLEVFVLIIGIYGAFAVDNWNEDRKERKIEREYIISIIEDIQSDASNFTRLVSLFETKEKELDTVLRLFPKLRTEYNDTLWRNLPTVINYADFIYTDRTMKQLNNSGGMRFIVNKAARDGILDYDLVVQKLLTSYQPDLNFYYTNSNLMWFELLDIESYTLDKEILSIKEMEQANKRYLLKSDQASLGKFNNIIRNFLSDAQLIRKSEEELLLKAESLIALLIQEYKITKKELLKS